MSKLSYSVVSIQGLQIVHEWREGILSRPMGESRTLIAKIFNALKKKQSYNTAKRDFPRRHNESVSTHA